jgi:hypothetical protein
VTRRDTVVLVGDLIHQLARFAAMHWIAQPTRMMTVLREAES